jgi:hypothetical protein
MIVLVIGSKNGKGLLASAGVMRAFCGLDCSGSLHSWRMLEQCIKIRSLSIREQLGLLGYFPFVFVSAGSRVAVTLAAKARTEMNVKLRILIGES